MYLVGYCVNGGSSLPWSSPATSSLETSVRGAPWTGVFQGTQKATTSLRFGGEILTTPPAQLNILRYKPYHRYVAQALIQCVNVMSNVQSLPTVLVITRSGPPRHRPQQTVGNFWSYLSTIEPSINRSSSVDAPAVVVRV